LGGDYVSTALAPIEVFQSAGVLWTRLHDQPEHPRFRVHTASVDGGPVPTVCSLKRISSPEAPAGVMTM
jgi:hypothetical protein